MNTRIWKLTALVLALMLALTGCSLIEIDQEMDNAEAVAVVNGEVITKGEVKNTYDYYVNYYNYMSSYYGTTMDTSSLKGDIIELFVKNKIVEQKAKELGLDQLSDEDKATVEAKAAETLDEYVTEHGDEVNTEGMSDEDARAAVLKHLEEEGVTLDALIEDETASFIANRVRESVIADVAVADSDLEEAYNKEVSEDESAFTNSTYLYELYRTNGTTIYWNPEGYRTVKHILLKRTDEQAAALKALQDELNSVEDAIGKLEAPADDAEAPAEAEKTEGEATEGEATEGEATEGEAAEGETAEAAEGEIVVTLEDLEARRNELLNAMTDLDAEHLASFSEKIEEIQAKLAEGADFEALIEEYGEDPGMQNEPTKTTGYYISASSSNYDAAFAEAAMALEKVGDVSEPVLGTSGVHIIRYESDVTPGPVPMEEVRDKLSESLLSDKQNEAYDAAYQSWRDASKVQTYPNRLG